MSKKVYYWVDKHGNKRYENTTHADRVKMRNCRNRGIPLTPEERLEIFGDKNPTFIRK